MADLFISYSRHDQEFVRALVERLDARGKEAWVDWEGIPPTAEFMQEIYSGIEGSDAFVFVISPDSARSKVCRDEIAHAAEVNKRIVPILRSEPGDSSLPEAVASRNWLLLTDPIDLDDAADQVVEALDQDLEHVRRHTRLLEKALEWERAERDKSLLLRGSDLRTAESWLAEAPSKPEPAPTPLHYEYVQASRAAATGRQRVVIGAFGVGIAIALALATLAVLQRNRAIDERRTAESRLVASEALAQLGNRLDLGARLALAAHRIDPTPEARDSVFVALRRTTAIAGVIPTSDVTAMRFAPAGGRLAVGRADGRIDLFRGSPLRRELSVRLGRRAVHGLAFSADGRMLAAAGVHGKLGVWRLVGASKAVPLDPGAGGAKAVAFAPDGALVVAQAHRIAWWREGGGPPERAIPSPYPLDRLAVSRDGTVAAGGLVGVMVVPPRGRPIPLGSQLPVQDLAFGDDGRLGFVEGTRPYVWTPGSTPRDLGTTGATSIAFAPGGLVAAGTLDGRIALATAAGGRRPEMALSPDAVVALAFDAHGNELAAADANRITLWRVGSGSAQPASTGLDLAALDDLVMVGPHAFVAGGNGRLEEAGGAGEELAVAGAPTGLLTLAASRDGHVLAAGGTGSQTVVVWTRKDTGAPFRRSADRFHRTGDIPTALAIAAGSTVVAQATQHGTIDLWRLDPPSRAPTLVPTGRSPLTALAATPTGATLAAGARNGSIWLVDAETGRVRSEAKLPSGQVVDLALSPDGRTLAAASSVGTVDLIRGSRVVGQLRAGSAALTTVALDPSGDAVAAGDGSGALYLWRVRDGLAAGPPLPLPGKIVALSFDPTGHRLAVGLEDGSVVVLDRAYWDESTAIASLCGRLGAALTASERSTFLPGGRGTGACG